MKATLAALTFVVFASIPASGGELKPIPAERQQVSYNQGQLSVTSMQRNTVILGVLPVDSKNLVLFVGGRNLGAQPVNLGTENVAAEDDRRALRVFTFDKLAKRANNGAAWKNFANALSNGARAGVAAGPTRGTFNGNVYSPYGVQPYARFDGTATIYDPAQTALAQSAIQNDARRQADGIAAERESKLAALGNYLRTTTIYPGDFRGGIVEIEQPRPQSQLTIEVDFAGEKHLFDFQATR